MRIERGDIGFRVVDKITRCMRSTWRARRGDVAKASPLEKEGLMVLYPVDVIAKGSVRREARLEIKVVHQPSNIHGRPIALDAMANVRRLASIGKSPGKSRIGLFEHRAPLSEGLAPVAAGRKVIKPETR